MEKAAVRLLEIVRTRPNGISVNEARWRLLDDASPCHPTITPSVRSAFSRTKRALLESHLIREHKLRPFDLVDEDYALFAAHDSSSRAIRNARAVLLPLAIGRYFKKEFTSAQDLMLAAERDVRGRNFFDKMKVPERETKRSRANIKRVARRTLDALRPRLSEWHRAMPARHFDVVEQLYCDCVAIIEDGWTFSRRKDSSLVALLANLRKLDGVMLPPSLTRLLAGFDAELLSYGRHLYHHRRRVFLSTKARDLRYIGRYERHRPDTMWSRKHEATSKSLLLDHFLLRPVDLKRTNIRFQSLSYIELVEEVRQLFSVSEGWVRMLSLPKRLPGSRSRR